MAKEINGRQGRASAGRNGPMRELSTDELEGVVGGISKGGHNPRHGQAHHGHGRSSGHKHRRSGGFWSWLFG